MIHQTQAFAQDRARVALAVFMVAAVVLAAIGPLTGVVTGFMLIVAGRSLVGTAKSPSDVALGRASLLLGLALLAFIVVIVAAFLLSQAGR